MLLQPLKKITEGNHGKSLFFFCDLLSLVQDLSRIGDDLPTAVGSMNVDLWVARYLHWFIHSVFGVISVLYGFICFF